MRRGEGASSSSLGDAAARAHGYTGKSFSGNPAPKKKKQPVGNSHPPAETPLLRTITTVRQPGLEGEVQKASERASHARNQAPARQAPGPAVPRGRGLSRSQLAEKDRLVAAYVRRQTAGQTTQQKTDFASDITQGKASTTGRDLNYLRIRRTGGQQDAAAKQIGAKGTREQKRAAGSSFIASAPTSHAESRTGPRLGDAKVAGINVHFGSLPLLSTALENMHTGIPAQVIPLFTGGKTGKGIAEHAITDVTSFPYNAVKSGYALASAAMDARTGNFKPAETIAKGMASGFVGNVVQANAEGGAFTAAGRKHYKKAGEVFEAHPVNSILELSGVEGAVGRAAGATMRSGLLGASAKEAASTTRAPLQLIKDVDSPNLTVHRSYDRDVIKKALQVAAEKRAIRRGNDPNVATPAQFEKHIRESGDHFSAHAEDVRRANREEAAQAAYKTVPTRKGDAEGGRIDQLRAAADVRRGGRIRDTSLTRPEQHVLMPMVESRVSPHTAVADLEHESARLQKVYNDEYHDLSPVERKNNRQQVRALDQYRKDVIAGKADPEELMGHARRYKKLADTAERELIRLKVIDPEQALISKLRPYAVGKMGARYVETTREAGQQVTDTALTRENLRGAKKEEAAAKREMDEASHELAGASGRSAVLTRNVTGRATAERAVETDARKFRRSVKKSGKRATPAEVSKHIDDVNALLEKSYAGGGHGVRQARERLANASERYEKAIADRRMREDTHKRAVRQAKDETKVHPVGAHLEDAKGNYLPTEDVIKHMDDNGVEMPAFVTHRPDLSSSSAFFQNFAKGRKGVGRFKRTGEATRTGAHATDAQSMVEHVVRQQGVIDAVKAWDDHIGQFGIQKPGGGMFTWSEAERFAAERQNLRGGEVPTPKLVPVRAAPAKLGTEKLDNILSHQGPGMHRDLHGLLENRVHESLQAPMGPDREARNVVLMPEELVKRFQEHQNVAAGEWGKIFQKGTSAFRSTVLPLSTKWLLGNMAEGALRSAIVGVVPGRDARIGRRVVAALEKMDPEAGRDLRLRLTGGTLFGSAEGMNIHREGVTADVPGLRQVGRGAGAAARAPVVRETIAGLRGMQRTIFALNKSMERAYQHGVIGKQVRMDIQEMSGSWAKSVRAQEAAIQDVARGLKNTPAQVRYAKYVDETLGKYRNFSPKTRKAIQTVAPFAPWYLNSLRFVFKTLPAKHPVKTALIANVETTFDKDYAEQRKDAPPGDLGAAVRTKDGGYLTLARYTPFGAFTGGLATVGDPILPQVSSVARNIQGEAWTGQKLRGPGGDVTSDWTKAGIATNTLAESMIPGLSQARRLQEHGETPYDTSWVLHPQTKGPQSRHNSTGFLPASVDRIFNPLRPTYLKPSNDSSGQKLDPVAKALQKAAQSTTPQVGGKGLDPVAKALRDAAKAGEAEVPDYRQVARQKAAKYGLDPDIFERQINQESGFNPSAHSPAGAQGIAQIMPATAKGWGVNPNDPVQALDAAARNMKQYETKYGGIENALRAYNAGAGSIAASHGFAETNNYVKSIMGGKSPSSVQSGGTGGGDSGLGTAAASPTASAADDGQSTKLAALAQLLAASGQNKSNNALFATGVLSTSGESVLGSLPGSETGGGTAGTGVTDGGGGGKTLVVGDSLAVGTSPYLEKDLGNVTANAKVGRSSQSAIQVLKQKLSGGNYNRIVLDMGTNDGSAAQLAQSISEAKKMAGGTQIYIPTVNGPDAANKNRVIRQMAGGNVHVVDWAGHSQGKVGGDGIHASPQGYQSRAQLITQAMGGAGTSGSSSAGGGSARDSSGQASVADASGKNVAGWIEPVLQYARQQGWKGNVESGVRSLAEQTRIYNSGVRPAAKPGTSNHEMTAFPGGAIDVSDAAQLSAIIKRSRYRNKLVWAGAKDPVHFSHPHNGSY